MRASNIKRVVKEYFCNVIVLNNSTNDVEEQQIVVVRNTDKERQNVLGDGYKLLHTKSVDEKETTYEMPLQLFTKLCRECDKTNNTETTDENAETNDNREEN